MIAVLKEQTRFYKKSCLLCDPLAQCKLHNTHTFTYTHNKHTQNYIDMLIYILYRYSYNIRGGESYLKVRGQTVSWMDYTINQLSKNMQ